MITVTISVNGSAIFARSAVNRGPNRINPKVCDYEIDTGDTIQHDPGDGAVVLSHALLDTIKEQAAKSDLALP